jgi:hypothetical protein
MDQFLSFLYILLELLEEKIRHDKAMEKLETAKTEWNKERIKRLDFLHEQEKKERQGAEEFVNVDLSKNLYSISLRENVCTLLRKSLTFTSFTNLPSNKSCYYHSCNKTNFSELIH